MKAHLISTHRTRFTSFVVVLAASLCASTRSQAADPRPKAGSVAKVEVRKTADRYQLYVNGRPFYIKGAGLEFGSQEELALHGGNSFRTWRTENGQDSVDRRNLRINFDPANLILYGTGEPIAALETLAPLVISVHCKDGDWPAPGVHGAL